MLRAREIIKQLSTGPGFIPTLSNFIIRPPRSEYELSDLGPLIADLVAQHGGRAAQYLPNLVINTIVERIRKNIVTLAAFDIDDLDTIKYAAECAVPALIIHGKEDDFVLPQQSLSVADTFFAPCIHELVSGTHNDERDSRTEELIAAFLHLYLIDKRHPANCVSEKNTTTVQKETRPREAVERSETEQNAEHEPCNSVCTTTSESSMSKEEQQPSPIVTEVKALESVGKKNEVNIQKSEKALTSNTEPSQLQSPPPTSSTHNFSVDNTTTLLCAKPEPLHLHPLNLVSVEDNDNVEFAECTNKKIAEEQKEQQEEEEE